MKYVGLAAGGTERWLQTLAAHLPSADFDVTYFYADAAPYTGSHMTVPGTDPGRLAWMVERGVRLVEFSAGEIDPRRRRAPWIGTDLWDHFHPADFDLVQTAKAGRPEYPFLDLPVPVFEQVAYNGGVDHTGGIVRSGHVSQWQRAWWIERGGDERKTFVCPVAAHPPATGDDLRQALAIDEGDVVAGMHQRPSDDSFSPIPLEAFHRVADRNHWFILLGGSQRYVEQARALGIVRFVRLPPTSDAVDISRFLNTLDVYAHGRRDGETFGTVLAEALMHHVPCLSHHVTDGGNAQAETIGPGGMVATGVDAYANRLGDLLRDPVARGRFGDDGRMHAESRFTIRPIVDEMVHQYRRYFGDSHPSTEVARPLEIGEVAEGFLVAGDTADPMDPARSILTKRRLRPVLSSLLEVGGFPALVELGCHSASAVYVAAASGWQGDVRVVELEPNSCEPLRATLRLNGWQDRICIVHDTACRWRCEDALVATPAMPLVAVAPGAGAARVAAWLSEAASGAVIVLPAERGMARELERLVPEMVAIVEGSEPVRAVGDVGPGRARAIRRTARRADRQRLRDDALLSLARRSLALRERVGEATEPWLTRR